MEYSLLREHPKIVISYSKCNAIVQNQVFLV